MRLPNKITSYRESVLPNFSVILHCLSEKDLPLAELFAATKKHFLNVSDFFETLDCLFALGKIVIIDEKEIVHYVI